MEIINIITAGVIPEQYELLSILISFIFGYITAKRLTINFNKLLALMFILLFLWKVFNWQPTGIAFEFTAFVSFFFVTWIQAEKLWEYINVYLKYKIWNKE